MTTTTTDPQSVVDDFNAIHGSVTWVRYWTGTRDDAPKYNLTDGKAWLLGDHTPVVRVQGESSCIALTHVDALPGQPDGIEDDSHDLPDLAGAAERVGEYIAANGDGIYDVIDGHPLYARDLEALRRAADVVWAAEQYKTQNEKLTAALAQSREQAATFANEIGTLTAENARLRQQRDAAADSAKTYAAEYERVRGDLKTQTYRAERLEHQLAGDRAVIDAARGWRQMRRDWQTTPSQDSEALIAAIDALPKPSGVAR